MSIKSFFDFKKFNQAVISADYYLAEIAEQAGITTQALYWYRTGRSVPPVDKFSTICRLLGKPIEEFLTVEKNSKTTVAKGKQL